jgi:hypothetical protein
VSYYLHPVGRLNGIRPELGTILGPDLGGEYYVVSDHDEKGCLISRATLANMREAAEAPDFPRTIAEAVSVRQIVARAEQVAQMATPSQPRKAGR